MHDVWRIISNFGTKSEQGNQLSIGAAGEMKRKLLREVKKRPYAKITSGAFMGKC